MADESTNPRNGNRRAGAAPRVRRRHVPRCRGLPGGEHRPRGL